MKQLTVTIGIPAYNEENNIIPLLTSLVNQKMRQVVIEKIIVMSDGSSDNTVGSVRLLKNKKIHVIDDSRRIGKPARLNELFDEITTDFVVILDADIKIRSSYLVENLLLPMLRDDNIMLTSGKETPLAPGGFFEHIVYAGEKLWEETKKRVTTTQMYLCEGKIRALRKQLYKEMRFPLASADDVYPYLYAMRKNYGFASVPEAIAYFRLPTTFSGYTKQMYRFLQSEDIHKENFEESVIADNFVINTRTKISVLVKALITDVFWTTLYIALLLFPKIMHMIKKEQQQSVWEVITSTKQVRG